jgi:hypothetical protein
MNQECRELVDGRKARTQMIKGGSGRRYAEEQ